MKKIIFAAAFACFLAMAYYFFFARELIYGSLALIGCVVFNIIYAVLSTPPYEDG